MWTLLPPLFVFIAVFFGAGVIRKNPQWGGFLISLGSALSFASLFFPHVEVPSILAHEWGLHLVRDGTASFFVSVVMGIGFFIGLFAASYMPGGHSFVRFFSSLALFQFAMVGIALSSDWLSLVVFWELTSISSFLLIAHENDSLSSQKGAMRALTITALGGLALLAAGVVAWGVTGSWELAATADWIRTAAVSPADIEAAVLWIFGGALIAMMSKSAQFPFHFWLPGAMAAPTPVSAYLHSATLVKAGLLLALKLVPVFSTFPYWQILVPIGLVTYVLGGFFALTRDDMKELLAYSTIAQLGLLFAFIGIGTPMAIAAAGFHLLSHALFKATLFMGVGNIDHAIHTRKLSEISGLARAMPFTAVTMTLSALSMAGFPLLMGFVSKEWLLEIGLRSEGSRWISWVVAVGAVFTTAYVLRLIVKPFWSKIVSHSDAHEADVWGVAGPVCITALTLLGGLYPKIFIPWIDGPLASGFRSRMADLDFSLAAFHGFNEVFFMSLGALTLGFLLFLARSVWFAGFERLSRVRGAEILDGILSVIYGGGKKICGVFHDHWHVNQIMRIMFVSVSGIILYLLAPHFVQISHGVQAGSLFFRSSWSDPEVIFFLATVFALSVTCVALITVTWRQRWGGAFALGGMGTMIMAMFFLLGAPDLVLTQGSIELVSLALFAIVLIYTERDRFVGDDFVEGWVWKIARVFGAVLFGGVGFVLTWIALIPHGERVAARYYGEVSKVLAGGANVVNVILVDFRGFDTLGEIAVFGSSALSLAAVLRRPGLHEQLPRLGLLSKSESSWERNWFVSLVCVILIFALFFIGRGHNAPGGGFIGGLVLAIVFIAIKFFWPTGYRELRPLPNGMHLVGFGFAFALVSVMVPMLWGDALFRSYLWGTFSTATFFDLGLAFLVAGTVSCLIHTPNESLQDSAQNSIFGGRS